MTAAPASGKWLLTLTVMLGTMMNAIDSSIVNVAIPYMRGSLGASVEEISWVATGYILSNVIIMPLIALVSSRIGRKRFYFYSVVAFTVSSILCGLATNLWLLVLARVIQGIGGGALGPLSQSIMRERFAPHEQGTAMGIFGLGVVVGPAFGPTLGGWLVDHFSWPWIFYINVPFGVINALMVLRYLDDPPYLVRQRGRIDLAGVGLLVLSLCSLQLFLEEGQRYDWFNSGFILSLAFLAFSGILLFVWRELTVEDPAVDLSLLGNANFASGIVISGTLGMGLYASMFLLPLFLQQLLGYPAIDSGLALMPRSIAMGLTLPIAGRLYNRVGPRWLVGCGLFSASLSFFLMSRLSLDAGYWELFGVQFLQGMGFGMTFVSVSTAALTSVERERIMAASGLYNVFRQVFGSIGIALAATQFTSGQSAFRSYLAERTTALNPVAHEWLHRVTDALAAKGGDQAIATGRALRILEGMVMRQAAMLSYCRIFAMLSVLFLCLLPLTLLLKARIRPVRT